MSSTASTKKIATGKSQAKSVWTEKVKGAKKGTGKGTGKGAGTWKASTSTTSTSSAPTNPKSRLAKPARSTPPGVIALPKETRHQPTTGASFAQLMEQALNEEINRQGNAKNKRGAKKPNRGGNTNTKGATDGPAKVLPAPKLPRIKTARRLRREALGLSTAKRPTKLKKTVLDFRLEQSKNEEVNNTVVVTEEGNTIVDAGDQPATLSSSGHEQNTGNVGDDGQSTTLTVEPLILDNVVLAQRSTNNKSSSNSSSSNSLTPGAPRETTADRYKRLLSELKPKTLGDTEVRYFCRQVLLPQLDDVCITMLGRLLSYERRGAAAKLQNVSARDAAHVKIKRRMVRGIRQVRKMVRSGDALLCIFAPDVERVNQKNAPDTEIAALAEQCETRDIPFCFALTMRGLAKAVATDGRVTCIAIVDGSGCEQLLKQCKTLGKRGRDQFETALADLEASRRTGDGEPNDKQPEKVRERDHQLGLVERASDDIANASVPPTDSDKVDSHGVDMSSASAKKDSLAALEADVSWVATSKRFHQCQLCGISCSSKGDLANHLQGKKHKAAKVATQRQGPSVEKSVKR